MSSPARELHSRKRTFVTRTLNGEDDDDSDIEVIPVKQLRSNIQQNNGTSLKENLISFLHWMKFQPMLHSFVSSVMKAFGYDDNEDSSDEFEEVAVLATTPRSIMLEKQKENGFQTAGHETLHKRKQTNRKGSPYPRQLTPWRRPPFGQRNKFSTMGNSNPSKKCFTDHDDEPMSSNQHEHRILSQYLSHTRDNTCKWSPKKNGEHISPWSHGYSSLKKSENIKKAAKPEVSEISCLKLLDRSELIKDRCNIPLRRREISNDVQFIKEVPSSDVLLSRTKLVLRSKGQSASECCSTHLDQTVSVPSSGGATKFTTNDVFNRQEKEMYRMLLDNYFSGGSWKQKETKPTYKNQEIQVNSSDIDKAFTNNKSLVEKYLKKYQQKTLGERETESLKTKNAVSRPINKEYSPEDEVIFLGEEPFVFKEKPRRPLSIPTAPPSPFFTSEWINQLKKSVEEEAEERLKITEEQNRQIEECRKKVRQQLSSGTALSEIRLDREDFIELTPEMENIIENALSQHAPDEVLSQVNQQQVLRKDIDTLNYRNWLNDEVINFYLSLIVERSKQPGLPSAYAFSSFFFTSLKSKGYSAVKRWTRKVNIFSYDLNLIPLHLDVHWCLGVVDFRHKKISYYDSMGGRDNCLEMLKNYLMDESRDKRKIELDMSDWSLEVKKDIPQQMNGYDCGMFTLKYAEYVTRDAPITFNQQNMPYFRRKMVYEIMTRKIL